MKKLLILYIVVGLFGCAERSKTTDTDVLMVSIQPLKYLVDSIVGEDLEVLVLVPPGSSPETYEPTPIQIKAAETADLLFFTGLIDFERALIDRLPDKDRFVDLSAGIELIEGSCGHGHSHTDHSHHHGVDPHIWTSPKALLKMAETAYKYIRTAYPDSLSYTRNYDSLRSMLLQADRIIEDEVSKSRNRSFMIFHPGLTYYARDYGLRQIAIEQDGKEPSVRQLQQIVEQAKKENITRIFYQSEFPRTVVEVAAAEIGADPIEIDILGYEVVDNILSITDLIVSE